MSEHAAFGRGAEPLTAYERARLRPGVDAAALEQLLALLAAAGHGGVRPVVVAAFARSVTLDDGRAAIRAHDFPPEHRAALERELDEREAVLAAQWRARHPEAPPDAPAPPSEVPPEEVRIGFAAAIPEAGEICRLWRLVDPAGRAPEPTFGPAGGPRLCDACGLREATVTVFRGGGDTPDGHVRIDAADLPPDVRRLFEELARAQRDRPPAPRPDEPRTETHLCEVCARQQRRSA